MIYTGMIFVISAPSGGGKTSLIKALLARMPGLDVSISHTTREQRLGEIDGEAYHFISHTQFEAMIVQGQFLEYAQVFQHYYGTSLQEIDRIIGEGKNVLLDIDWQGAQVVRRLYKERQVSIFLVPPSSQELQLRLERRGRDTEAEIQYRMAQAKLEIQHYAEYDYLIINEDFEQALGELSAIIIAEQLKVGRQAKRYTDCLQDLLANAG